MKSILQPLTRLLVSISPWHKNTESIDEYYEHSDSAFAPSERRRTHSNTQRPRLANRPDPVEVAAALPVLEALSMHLEATASDLQDSVLEISSGFGGMAARARETVQIAQGGLSSENGFSADQTISQIRDVLGNLLKAVQESTQVSSKLANRIGTLESVLSQVNESLKRVEKISDEARIVGLNGRLEAARAGNHGAAFNVVANETKNLGLHASATSASIRKLVDELDQSLRAVSEELHTRIQLDAETARRSEETVMQLLNQLSVMHYTMTDSLHRTEHLSESLSRDIGRSVMALQFQDRVNQRLDHVVEALRALQENLTPFQREVSAQRVESRANDWREWLDSRSTMKSEREVLCSAGSNVEAASNDAGSVELF